MQHIFNLSEIKKRMKNHPPKAQRLQRLMNENELDAMTEESAQELINVIRVETENTIKFIKENVPFKLI